MSNAFTRPTDEQINALKRALWITDDQDHSHHDLGMLLAAWPVIARETLKTAANHLDVIGSASMEELPVRPSPGEYLRAQMEEADDD